MKYGSYKKIQKNWFKEVPEHWTVARLSYFADVVGGSTPSSSNETYWNGAINWVTTDDLGKLNGKEINTTKRTITEEGLFNCSASLLPKDSVIISSRAPIGHLGILNVEAATNQGCKGLVLKRDQMDSRFLFYYLFAAKNDLQSLGSGSTFTEISSSILKSYYVIIPEIQEQTKIAQYLDHQTGLIDTIIERKQQLIEKLKEQRRAIINEAMTKGFNPDVPMKDSGVEWLGEIPEDWRIVKLKWISEIYAGGTPSKNITEYWENGTIPWLNSGSVNDKRIKEPFTYITEEALNNSSAKWIPKGALVMALAGQGKTKGTVALLEIDTTCNQSMGAIVLNEKLVSNEFIFYWLESNYYRIRGLAGTEQRDGLNLQIIGNIFCPIPSIQEQTVITQKINEKVLKIDHLKSKIDFQIKILIEYRQSIIFEAVTGKIDVREWEPKLRK